VQGTYPALVFLRSAVLVDMVATRDVRVESSYKLANERVKKLVMSVAKAYCVSYKRAEKREQERRKSWEPRACIPFEVIQERISGRKVEV
jgi:hypothetical protein